jgi:hypothetical protein
LTCEGSTGGADKDNQAEPQKKSDVTLLHSVCPCFSSFELARVVPMFELLPLVSISANSLVKPIIGAKYIF